MRQRSWCDVYKPSFHLCSTTPIPVQSFEGLDAILRHVRVAYESSRYIGYRHPAGSLRQSGYLSTNSFVFLPRSRLNESFSVISTYTAAMTVPAMIVHCGDYRDLTDLLRETNFQQHVTEPTHVGGKILDLVITRPRDNAKHV